MFKKVFIPVLTGVLILAMTGLSFAKCGGSCCGDGGKCCDGKGTASCCEK